MSNQSLPVLPVTLLESPRSDGGRLSAAIRKSNETNPKLHPQQWSGWVGYFDVLRLFRHPGPQESSASAPSCVRAIVSGQRPDDTEENPPPDAHDAQPVKLAKSLTSFLTSVPKSPAWM